MVPGKMAQQVKALAAKRDNLEEEGERTNCKLPYKSENPQAD